MNSYTYYIEPANTTLSFKTAVFLGAFMTFTTVLGIAHGHHAEKTASKVDSYQVSNMLKISRREDELS